MHARSSPRPQERACGPAGFTRLPHAPSRAHARLLPWRARPSPSPRRRRLRATRATRPATPPRSAPRSTACWAATSATSTWSARAWRRTGACSACACTGRRAAWPPRCSRRPCWTPSCCWSTRTRRTSWRAPQGGRACAVAWIGPLPIRPQLASMPLLSVRRWWPAPCDALRGSSAAAAVCEGLARSARLASGLRSWAGQHAVPLLLVRTE